MQAQEHAATVMSAKARARQLEGEKRTLDLGMSDEEHVAAAGELDRQVAEQRAREDRGLRLLTETVRKAVAKNVKELPKLLETYNRDVEELVKRAGAIMAELEHIVSQIPKDGRFRVTLPSFWFATADPMHDGIREDFKLETVCKAARAETLARLRSNGSGVAELRQTVRELEAASKDSLAFERLVSKRVNAALRAAKNGGK